MQHRALDGGSSSGRFCNRERSLNQIGGFDHQPPPARRQRDPAMSGETAKLVGQRASRSAKRFCHRADTDRPNWSRTAIINPTNNGHQAGQPLLLERGIERPKRLVGRPAHPGWFRWKGTIERVPACAEPPPNILSPALGPAGGASDCDAYFRRRHRRHRKLLAPYSTRQGR